MQFDVSVTGILPGETIVAFPGRENVLGSSMMVMDPFPPLRPSLDRLDQKQWIGLLSFMKKRPHFSSMETEEIREWLNRRAIDKREVYLSDVDLKVENVTLSGKDFISGLTEENIDRFGSNSWTIRDIYNAFIPKKEDTKARRKTLVFRPWLWMLNIQTSNIIDDYKGLLIIPSKPIAKGVGASSLLLHGVPYALMLEEYAGSHLPKKEDLLNIIKDLTGERKEANDLWSLLSAWATPALYKSLIQKIIRTGCYHVSYTIQNGEEKLFEGKTALLVAFASLILHPGSFDPDLQMFITGLESGLKRAAVSITEDSFSKKPELLSTLFACALAAKQNRGSWFPSLSLIKWIMEELMKTHQNPHMYEYKTTEPPSAILDEERLHTASYLLLAEIKSFHTDVNMLGWIAFHEGKKRDSEAKAFIKEMPILHAIDQHVYPDFVYCVDYQHKEDDFEDFFGLVWDSVSGINPRKETFNGFDENDEFVRKVRRGQKAVLMMRSYSSVKRRKEEGIYTFSTPLHSSWLSGLVGPISVNVRKKFYLVSINPHDPYDYCVMYDPKRALVSSESMEDKERKDVIEKFKDMLNKGIGLAHLTFLPWLKRSKLYLIDNAYFIRISDGEMYSWNVALNPEHDIPLLNDVELSIENAILWRGDGIVLEGEKKIIKLLDSLNDELLMALYRHMRFLRSSIILPGVSKSGKGTDYAVRAIDVDVHLVLCHLCCLAPFALRKKSIREIKVIDGAFFLWIKDQLERLIMEKKTYSEWKKMEDTTDRKLLDYQKDVVEQILSAPENRRMFIIAMDPGVGKSKIVMEVISILNKQRKLPSFVIWALPSSALASVEDEVRQYNALINIIIPIKVKKRNLTIKPYSINIIKHDHLKRKDTLDLLRSLSGNFMLIVDEFHEAMNPTLRTSALLEASRSSDMCICLSGTPMKDGKIDLMIPWIEQAVSFEVTLRNIWTGLCSMISRRVDLPITIVRKNLEAPMTSDEESEYNRAFYAEDVILEPQVFRRIVELCYEACLRTMINETMIYLSQNRYVLLVARNIKDQKRMKEMLINEGVGIDESTIILVTKDSPIVLTDEDKTYRVAITTIHHTTGYTAVKMSVLITSVYFTDEATRIQLVGRIHRVSQRRNEIDVITTHTGILTRILDRYEQGRNMIAALKSIAQEIEVPLSAFTSLV